MTNKTKYIIASLIAASLCALCAVIAAVIIWLRIPREIPTDEIVGDGRPVATATPIVTEPNIIKSSPLPTISGNSDYDKFLIYVLGTNNLADPALKEQLLAEQKAIRTKYKLVDRTIYTEANASYFNQLENIVEREQIELRYDMDAFLASKGITHQGVLAVYDSETDIIHLKDDFDKNNATEILTFEHELVHALQDIYEPETLADDVQSEYEAYIAATATPGRLDPDKLPKLMENMYGSITLSLDEDNEPYPWR